MSDSDLSTQLTNSQAASSLCPSIVGLFIQGIESGLVLAEFSRWFSGDRRERCLVSIIAVFVTIVGLAQSGLYFASALTTGRDVQIIDTGLKANWEDDAQLIPNLLISVPVQSLMIRRCYKLVGNKKFIITLLVLLLVVSTVMSLWSIVLIVNYLSHPEFHWLRISVSWPYLLSVLLPMILSVLDLVLTAIILCDLARKKEQVYSTRARELISRFVKIVWQSALPPTICAICLSGIYIKFSSTDEITTPCWLAAVQAMIGKLYVLSLFYWINAQSLRQLDERPMIVASTLTVPMEAGTVLTVARGTEVGGDHCSEIDVADYGVEKRVGFAV